MENPFPRIAARISGLSPLMLSALAALVLAAAAVAAVMLYRTYDYVQHDNDFCLSCHLMRDPYERFALSAHRDLGCKACHQPTFTARSTMALTQVIEQPEALQTHAEVPNQRCEDCHVTGDPEKWQQIASSAGHRIHLESADPSLRDVQCVKCHSSSVHEFAATDQTCGQAGCHEDTRIRLGKMGQLTIHCAACHNFSTPVAASASADTLAVALRPQREECLSCHAMRRLVSDFPEHDPHAGACGACHQPHEQETPAQAVESCATAGCHDRVETETAFHRGLGPGVLTQCTSCHTAHEFAARGTSCLGCHENVYQSGASGPSTQRVMMGGDSLTFRHVQHRDVECTQCHDAENSHGGVTVTSFAACQQCHHVETAGTSGCIRCHERQELNVRYREPQTLRIAQAAAVTRQLPFDHGAHQTQACSACHQAGPTQSVAGLECSSCHEQHHEPDTQCRACHTTPRDNAHNMRSHLTCAGAQCHDPVPFQGVPRTRELCLSCHQQQVNHQPGRNCAQCHTLPGSLPGAARGSGD
jgi:nitrate/TMAO reductase-like tetraheme cytochrome c subunit